MADSFGRITAGVDVIYPRYDPDGFVGREWLIKEVSRFRDHPDLRDLVIVGKPGSGKSTFLAYLAEAWNCPRHFIRADNKAGVTGLDSKAFLVSLGAQLFQKYGRAIFTAEDPGTTQVIAGLTTNKAEVVGRFIKDLYTLPFLPPHNRDVKVLAGITTSEGRVIGERIGRMVTDVSLLDELTLLHEALINPVKKIQDVYPQEKVLVLIDGLDESLQHSGKRILDIIPRADDPDFPSNLRIIMTSRPGDHLLSFRSQDLLNLDDEQKGYRKESLTDTRAYIVKRIAEPSLAEALSAWNPHERDAFLHDVELNGAGNFLYLYYFFNVAAKTLSTDPKSAEKLGMPADLDEIYRFFAVDRIKASISVRDWVELYLPLLGVLAVVREPIGRELLAGFAGVPVEYVDYIRGQISQFLDIVHEEREDRYRLYHSSFGEYLLDRTRNRDYPLDGPANHYRIAAYYRGRHDHWVDVDWDIVTERYPFWHLATHLMAAGKGDELYGLIDKPWMLAKFKRTHSHRAFAEDVELALTVAGSKQPPDVVQEVRGCLIYATLRSLANYTPDLYVNFVEHPARMECGVELAATEFPPSYRRGTIMQVTLAALCLLSSIAAWLAGATFWWVVAGTLQVSVIPFTLIVILPTNEQLVNPSLDKRSAETGQLLARWGALHAVRSVLSAVALLLFLYLAIFRKPF